MRCAASDQSLVTSHQSFENRPAAGAGAPSATAELCAAPPAGRDTSCTLSRVPFSCEIAASVRLFMTMMLMRRLIGLSGACRIEQHARREADDAADFLGRQAAAEQRAARSVRAIGRKLPVAVVHLHVRPNVGVPADADAIRHAVRRSRRARPECFALKPSSTRAAEREHRAAFVIDDLDAHAFRRHVEQNLILELRERLALIDRRLAQLSEQAFEPFRDRAFFRGFCAASGVTSALRARRSAARLPRAAQASRCSSMPPPSLIMLVLAPPGP